MQTRRKEQALQQALESGLLQLPGLRGYHFIKGIKGRRCGRYTAIWVYENRKVWEQLWGPPDYLLSPEQYPENWKRWEEEVHAPFLDRDPDEIDFTSCEVI